MLCRLQFTRASVLTSVRIGVLGRSLVPKHPTIQSSVFTYSTSPQMITDFFKSKRKASDADIKEPEPEKCQKLESPVEAEPVSSVSISDDELEAQYQRSMELAKNDRVEWARQLENSVPPSWRKHLEPEFNKPYWKRLKENLVTEFSAGHQVFPAPENVFRALLSCPFDDIRIVIVGQDPYHDDGQAEGLAFSVPPGVRVPSSLSNIYKELETDIDGFVKPKHGHLQLWADRGSVISNAIDY